MYPDDYEHMSSGNKARSRCEEEVFVLEYGGFWVEERLTRSEGSVNVFAGFCGLAGRSARIPAIRIDTRSRGKVEFGSSLGVRCGLGRRHDVPPGQLQVASDHLGQCRLKVKEDCEVANQSTRSHAAIEKRELNTPSSEICPSECT